ncbi:hypothetical protein HMPREF0476_0935 [Kingella kingae ATCC 23330]|uniref:Uncharacterized protein n=1 Tax=Kingella kingae ATCC 23330 TaxID=887327 RepID=F5S6V2_KINKI|nr:hypothetical protein HMPREF0476_0935 [Kingella kingae ATCC 23330]
MKTAELAVGQCKKVKRGYCNKIIKNETIVDALIFCYCIANALMYLMYTAGVVALYQKIIA